MALKSTTTAYKNEKPRTTKTTEARESKINDTIKLKVAKKKHSGKSKCKELHIRKRPVTSKATTESICENNIASTTLSFPYIVPKMATFYPRYSSYTYPATINECNSVIPLQNILYSVPLIISPTQILTTQIYPYVGIVTQPIISPGVSQVCETLTIPYTYDPLVTYASEHEGSPVENINTAQYYIIDEGKALTIDSASFDSLNNIAKEVQEVEIGDVLHEEKDAELDDSLGFYLALPKELFPSARTLYIDPNPIIDEFCKISNLHEHSPWILDLEFGIPKSPITRPIPTYNVKFNSIHCKNTPDAIHPGFESCNQDFKRVLLFYYDCVVSTWYKGFMILNHDKSVENFQSWLIPPVQVLGMCWS